MKTDLPFVSVVIPTYNRANLAITAIESVLAQRYPHYEVVIVDDGSTDETSVAIRQLVASRGLSEEKLRYVIQSNQGQSSARNRGVTEARGEWIAFLDSDDVWLPDKLDLQIQAVLRSSPACGACTSNAYLVDKSGVIGLAFRPEERGYTETFGVDGRSLRILAKSFGNYWLSVILAKKSLIQEIGGFDPLVEFGEDHDFHFRLALATQFCYVNRPLVRIYRTPSPPGSDSRPWEKLDVRLRSYQLIYEKWLEFGSQVPADVRKVIKRDLREVHSYWANWHLEHQRYPEARSAVTRAVRYELTPKLIVKWLLTAVTPALARQITPTAKPYL